MVAALFVGDVGKFLFNFLTARHFCILLLNGDFRLPSSVFSLRIWLLRFFWGTISFVPAIFVSALIPRVQLILIFFPFLFFFLFRLFSILIRSLSRCLRFLSVAALNFDVNLL